ncbi:MAG: hypothetical protein GOV00_02345 [Candidatus Altiarchaeota archaeon]|nr:hypothetical protein [Candidatus Altiarchaeota archaeon]
MDHGGAISKAVELLELILEDSAVPRNIKNTCRTIIERLNKEGEVEHIRAGAATCILDEFSQDPNLPFHTRAQVWEIASILETVKSPKIKY